MPNSANAEGGGLRARKRTATRAAITEAARMLTADRGVSGFTVEELCERVGISRRTFFNYFPAKEDAILGVPGDDLPEDLVQRFLDGGGACATGLSETLLEDFIELAVGMVERMAMSRQEMGMLRQAIHAEPRLIQKAMHGSRQAQDTFAELLGERERLPASDPRIQLAVALFGTLVQHAGEEFFTRGATDSYRSILTQAVDAARQVFRQGGAARPAPPPRSGSPSRSGSPVASPPPSPSQPSEDTE